MPADRSDDEPVELRVTDRRRFTESGDARPGNDDVSSGGDEPGQADVSREGAGSSANQGGAAGAAGVGSAEADELGVEAVFYAFWESAMMSLGAPDQLGRSGPVDLDSARNAIGLLKVLEQKTSGNLTREEEQLLQRLLYQAQLQYARAADGAPGGPA